MRHLGSLILSLILTPVVYVLTGVGLIKFDDASTRSGASKYTALTIALIALFIAGAAYSLLLLARLSPLGLFVGGLVLFATALWAVVSPGSFRDTVPGTMFGVQAAGWLPARSGITVLLAVPLLATIVSPRRWRRYATAGAAVAPYNAAPTYPPTYPQTAAPSYGPPFYGTEPASTPTYGDPETTHRLPG